MKCNKNKRIRIEKCRNYTRPRSSPLITSPLEIRICPDFLLECEYRMIYLKIEVDSLTYIERPTVVSSYMIANKE